MDPLDWFLIVNFYVMLGSSPSWNINLQSGKKSWEETQQQFPGNSLWPFWDGDPWPELKGYISDLPTTRGSRGHGGRISWLLCCFFLRKEKSGIGHSKRWRPWSDRWSWRLQVGLFGADRVLSVELCWFHPYKWPKINGFPWGEITFTYNLQARICLFLVIFLRIGIPWDEIFTIKPATIWESMLWNCFPSFFCKSKITVGK